MNKILAFLFLVFSIFCFADVQTVEEIFKVEKQKIDFTGENLDGTDDIVNIKLYKLVLDKSKVFKGIDGIFEADSRLFVKSC